ncbi:class II aldolase/adducin family protein [Desertimonas flava]|uniref:class II aldolase/adducin family protein n=1 Tax=Desertimonas flava TaxID=2064846 RepID=UPI0013C4AF46|nr:class II aldolase/adducin family protein [Desertimonas flava]
MTSTLHDQPDLSASTAFGASAERDDARRRLAAALRMFHELDFDEGAAGHLSVRDPLDPELFWINPDGVPFELITAADLVLSDRVGNAVGGGDGAPSPSAWRLHAAVYGACPDVNSAMHAHPVATKAWAAVGRLLDPINQEACIFYGCHSVFEDYDGPFSGGDEAGKVAAAVGGTNIAVVLANHGLLTVGRTVGSAAYRFMIFDRSVRVQILAEQAGTPRRVRHEVASALAGSEDHCTSSFEPIYRSLLARSPDIG